MDTVCCTGGWRWEIRLARSLGSATSDPQPLIAILNSVRNSPQVLRVFLNGVTGQCYQILAPGNPVTGSAIAWSIGIKSHLYETHRVCSSTESGRSPPAILSTTAAWFQLSKGVLFAVNGALSAEISQIKVCQIWWGLMAQKLLSCHPRDLGAQCSVHGEQYTV